MVQSTDTGIIVADTDRLVLRAMPVPLRRRALVKLVIGFTAAVALAALLLARLFQPYVTYGTAAVAALVFALLYAYRFTTQVTFIALRSGDGIYVETKNRLLRTRRTRLLHAYGAIRAVRLRSRVNPNAALPGASPMGALIHYDVVLDTGGRSHLLWYTRYRECAEQIAAAIARFAGARSA